MIQAHQPTWCVDSWPYYEFEDYIKLLNDRNEEERKSKEDSGGSDSFSKTPEYRNMMKRMGNIKTPNYKIPKFK